MNILIFINFTNINYNNNKILIINYDFSCKKSSKACFRSISLLKITSLLISCS